MVDDFHKQGILVQLWWLPIGVEDGEGRWESHKYRVAEVVKQHPEWLILDKNGKHGRMTRNLAALCPAVPEVQEYYKKLTEKFIRDWDFDGSKLDNIYTVPMCYNPAHHHKSPQDSVNAVADVYKTIFQTTRAFKPESVTQSCPCGTPPSLAWLPYMDQAVTADPVGAVKYGRASRCTKRCWGRNRRCTAIMWNSQPCLELATTGSSTEMILLPPSGQVEWWERNLYGLIRSRSSRL